MKHVGPRIGCERVFYSFDDFFSEFLGGTTYQEFIEKYDSKRASEIVNNLHEIWLRLQTFSQAKNLDEMNRYKEYMDNIFKNFIGYTSHRPVVNQCEELFIKTK